MIHRTGTTAVLGLLCLSMLVTAAHAQTTATMSGVVRDESGAVLPGATVTITNLETAVTHSLTTDTLGRYNQPQLMPGNYQVKGALSGFKTTIRDLLTLTVADRLIIDLVLSVGALEEVVHVSGESPLIQTASTDVAALIDYRTIRDLPINGRSFDNLITLNAGSVSHVFKGSSTSSGFGNQFSVGGARPDFNHFTVDGTQLTGTNLAEGTPGSVSGQLLGIDGIREFKVLRNSYSAEYGKFAGAQVVLATRSGTNEYHGSVFSFHRNQALDARDFFDRLPEEPAFERNNFGAAFGGPVRRGRTFFFTNYEGLRESLGLSNVAVVPDMNARRGLLPDPNNPGSFLSIKVDPAVLPYFSLWPEPNGRDFGDGTAEFFSNPVQTINDHFLLGRVDHRFGDSDSMFVSYSFNQGDLLSPQQNPRVLRTADNRVQLATVEHTHSFSGNTLNVVRLGYTRSFFETDQVDPNATVTLIPGRPMGTISIGSTTGTTGLGGAGIATGGGAAGTDLFNLLNQFSISNDVHLTRGSHALKVGGMAQSIALELDGRSFKWGNMSFDSLQQFLENRARTFTFQDPGPRGNFINRWAEWLFGFYVQDQWQARQNLTVNLGLRYEFTTKMYEEDGRVATSTTGAELIVFGDPPPLPPPLAGIPFTRQEGRSPFLENNSLRGLAPRVGAAWTPFAHKQTVVSGGFGVFFNQITPSAGGLAWRAGDNFPWAFSGTIRNAGLPSPLDVPGTLRRPGLAGVDPFLEVPRIVQYNVSLQQQILPDTALMIGYVGSRGDNLMGLFPTNAVIPELLSSGEKVFTDFSRGGPVPNSNFEVGGSIVRADRRSWYDALELEVTRRLSRGLRFKAAYTYAKNLDEGSATVPSRVQNDTGGTSMDPRDVRRDKGPAAFDVRHAFRFNYTYELPSLQRRGVLAGLLNGWTMNGILSLVSGPPFTPQIGFPFLEIGGGPQRPDMNPAFTGNPLPGGPNRWFDPNAFQLPQPGRLGNLGRNTLRADGVRNFDLSLFKDVSLVNSTRLQLRIEIFNVFNTVNFGIPDIAIFNRDGTIRGAAGQVRATTTPARQVQLGAKFLF